MQLITRPQFYLDVAEEVEYLATKAGPETALRWSLALDKTIQALSKHPELGRVRPIFSRKAYALGGWNTFGGGWYSTPYGKRLWFYCACATA